MPEIKSRDGHVIFYGGGPVTWTSNKQKTVAQSSCEAETYGTARICRKLLHIHNILMEQKHDLTLPSTIYNDNQATIKISETGILSSRRTNHLHLKHGMINELVNGNIVSLKYVKTQNNIADFLTKPLPKHQFKKLTQYLVCAANATKDST